MVCDHQKTGIIKVVAVSTVIQAALGIAILCLLYTQIPSSTPSSNPTANVASSIIPTVTASTVEETTINGTEVPKVTIIKNDDGFLEFFHVIDEIAIQYAGGQTEVRSFLGIAFIVDVLWLISVVSLLVAINANEVSHLRYQCLLPWIIATLLVCLVDVAGTVFFIYMLMVEDEQIQNELKGSIKDIVEYLFLQFFFSKAGIFWLLNVIFLVKIAQGYSYWKETHENDDDFDESSSNGIELAPYLGSVRKKPYDNGKQSNTPYDDEARYSDYGYTNDGYENTPGEQRHTNNPLHDPRYQQVLPNKYEPANGGDFRRFSAVDDYSAVPASKRPKAEKYPENREQSRRESQMFQVPTDPYRKPSQVGADPYRKPSQVGADPYRKPSQVGADPYRKPSQVGADPYRKPSQVGADPYRKESQARNDPYKKQSLVEAEPYRNQPRRDSQVDRRAVPSARGPQTSPIPEEDYNSYDQSRHPDYRRRFPQDQERSYNHQQKPSERNDRWNQPSPSNGKGRADHNYGIPYNQKPDRQPQQPSMTQPRDKYDKPGKQMQQQQPRSRNDDELFPIRTTLFAGPPPNGNSKSRQPTYLPHIEADKPYNIPRINLK